MPTLLALATLLLAPAHAEDPSLGEDVEVWTATFVQVAPDPAPTGLRGWLDLHARRSDAGAVGIVRPGVGWQLSPGASVWGGYAWVPVDADGAPATHEHRAWQQLTLQRTRPTVSVGLRVREEQRIRAGEDGMSHRLRVLPRVGLRLRGPLSLQVWDEVFVAWNETGWFPVKGYDQNRFFVGPAIEGFRGFRVEVGYLNLDLARGDASTNHHAAAMNLFLALAPPP
jgi:hypothetical protein